MSPPPGTLETADQARWFAAEVHPHEPMLRAWLHSTFPRLPDVDDLVQESYLRVIRAHRSGSIQHPKAFLFRTARNAALDRCRRDKIVTFEPLADSDHLPVLEESPTHSSDRELELSTLAEAIRSLPPRAKEILILRKHQGLSHQEIATRLNIAPNTVNAHLTTAMLKCRQFFRGRGLVPPS